MTELIRTLDLTKIDEADFKRRCVGCLVLTQDHKILLQQRPDHWRTHPGCLSTFGGEIEPSETSIEALIRELHEELGAKVMPSDVTRIGTITEAITNYSELIYLYFWHDKHGTITGCYEGEAKYYDTVAEIYSHPKLMDDVRWLLMECQNRRLLITTQIATALILEQFPQFAHLPIRPVDHGGNDNRTFHLGGDMSIRLPSAEGYERQVNKEQTWLPKIAPYLPLPIPVPIAMGMPSEIYPWNWSIYQWLDGESANSLELSDAHLETIAMQLANFLSEFHKYDVAGAPAPGLHNWWRAAHTSIYDAETRLLIEKLKDFVNVDNAKSLWQRAISSKWTKAPVWVHGDVASGNLLVKDNRLAAVIDFGCMGIGDPACDLTIAWTFFRGKSREIFKANMNLDEETWARARGWAMWKALYEISELEDTGGAALAKQQQIIDAVIKEDKSNPPGPEVNNEYLED